MTMTKKDLDKLMVFDKLYGCYTLLPSNLIPDNYVANALNMSFADLSPASMKQYSFYGNQLTLAGQILASFTATKANGLEVALRVRDDGTNSHYEWYNTVNSTWETLLANQTTLKIPTFADFNTATQDWTFWCNGTENYTGWKKAFGSVASNTATVITLNETLASTQGFATGTVIVNGTEYTYTGISGKTLTGLSGLPTFTVNAGVAEAPDDSTYSALAKMDILMSADGRMWGAISTIPRLYYSAVGDATNWTTGTSPDDPGVRDFVEGKGGITSLGALKEKIVVFKKDLVQLYWLEYPSATTRTSMLQEIRRGDGAGAVNHQGTIKVGQTVFYTTTKGGIKSIQPGQQQTDFDFEDNTEIVSPSLKNGVFTSAKSIYYEKENILLIAFKKSANSTRNDYIVAIEFATDSNLKKVKTITFIDWPVGGWFIFGNELYFGGSFEPNCFKAFDGYQRGTTDAPFTSLFTTKRYKFTDKPAMQKNIKYFIMSGYIGAGTIINIQLEYDYLGTRAHLEGSFSALETQYIIQPQLNVIGAFALGVEPIGGTMDDIDELNYFRVFFTLPMGHKPYDAQATIYSDKAGSRWKLECFGFVVEDIGAEIPSRIKKYLK